MARLFDDASSEYLMITAAPVTAVPLTLACWFKVDAIVGSACPICIMDADSTTEGFVLHLVDDAGDLEVWGRTASLNTWNEAKATASFSLNTWHHAAFVTSAVDSRAAYLDGGNKGTEATARMPTGIDTMTIGRLTRAVAASYVSGSVAETAIWNVALTDAEVAELAAGLCPLFVRPGALVAYYPLGGIYDANDGDHDIVGGYNMTAYNTPSTAGHPPKMKYPASPMVIVASAAVAGIIPQIMHHRKQQRRRR